MPQILEVLPAAGNGLLFLGTVHIVEISAHTVIAVAIGMQVSMLVAVSAGQGDVGQFGAAGGLAAARRQTQQATSLDGDHRIKLFTNTAEQVGIGLIGLVELQDGQSAQGIGDGRGQAVAQGDVVQHVTECGVAPAAFAFGLQPLAQVRRAGADAQHVGRAAVFGFVDGVGAFVDQAGVAPAEPQPDHRTCGRDGQQAVVVAEGDAELVGLDAAVVGQV
ncbi:hypothetical protein D3C81_1370780 [compost metagenome]